MALLLKDRVKETTTTTGTGTYTLAGAVAGFEAFSAIGDGNTTYYCCTDGTDFEIGVGTYTASGTTLARTTILQSSNSDAAVNWTSGSRTIFCTQPADKAVFLDASGNIDINGGAIDGVTLGTNSAVTEAQIDDININDGTIESSNSFSGLILKVNGQLIARVQSSNQSLTGGGLYLYQNNPYITFEGDTSDVYETNLKVTDPTANRDITLPDATGEVVLKDSSDVVTITSTDAGADEKPTLKLLRNSSSPADSDEIGEIEFVGRNDAAEDTTYFRVFTSIADVSNGSEDARLEFKGLNAGGEITYLQLKFGQIVAVRDLAMGTGRNVVF